MEEFILRAFKELCRFPKAVSASSIFCYSTSECCTVNTHEFRLGEARCKVGARNKHDAMFLGAGAGGLPKIFSVVKELTGV
jgi:hypothetical protein